MNFDNLNTKIQELNLSDISGGANYISQLHGGNSNIDALYEKILGAGNDLETVSIYHPCGGSKSEVSNLFIDINHGGNDTSALFVDIKKVSLRDTLLKF